MCCDAARSRECKSLNFICKLSLPFFFTRSHHWFLYRARLIHSAPFHPISPEFLSVSSSSSSQSLGLYGLPTKPLHSLCLCPHMCSWSGTVACPQGPNPTHMVHLAEFRLCLWVRYCTLLCCCCCCCQGRMMWGPLTPRTCSSTPNKSLLVLAPPAASPVFITNTILRFIHLKRRVARRLQLACRYVRGKTGLTHREFTNKLRIDLKHSGDDVCHQL
jgi:hypothetical protein